VTPRGPDPISSGPRDPAGASGEQAARTLDQLLERARIVGFLGPGPVAPHRLHAVGFAEVVEADRGGPPRSFADLGTGGGVPGLVLSDRWARTRALLIESQGRRSEFLVEAVAALGRADRCAVRHERAEQVARDPECREAFEVVTARGFADPAATAEIAAGLVAPGGVLVVSEPPEPQPERWPERALGELGFGAARPETAQGARFVVIPKRAPTPDAVPRGVGRPAKRPRW